MFNPGPQAISKARRGWPPSLNQPQPLAGKPGGLRAGPAVQSRSAQRIEQRGARASAFVLRHSSHSTLIPSFSTVRLARSLLPRSSSLLDVCDPRAHPAVLRLLWCRLDVSAPTLDIQAVLRETRKNRQDTNDKYKKWKKERKNYLFSSSEAHLYPRPPAVCQPLQIETLKIIFIFQFLLWFCKNAERQEIKVTGRYIFYGTWKIVVIPSL